MDDLEYSIEVWFSLIIFFEKMTKGIGYDIKLLTKYQKLILVILDFCSNEKRNLKDFRFEIKSEKNKSTTYLEQKDKSII